MFVGLLLMGLIVGVVLCSVTSYRSTRFSYPVTVQLPNGTFAQSIGYRCTFKREDADLMFAETDVFLDSFKPVAELQFDAKVHGYHTTKWCGLIEYIGRESFIVVRVESKEGEVLMGRSELPDNEAPVTVAAIAVP